MILHQQPPDPKECIKPSCTGCKFFPRCRQILESHKPDLAAAREDAVKASQGSIAYEDKYTPGG